jgi:hypothetical protein
MHQFHYLKILTSVALITLVGCNAQIDAKVTPTPTPAAATAEPIAQSKTATTPNNEATPTAASIAASSQTPTTATAAESAPPAAAIASAKGAQWEFQGHASTGESVSLNLNSIQATQRLNPDGRPSYFFTYQIGNDEVTAITSCDGMFAPFKNADTTDEFRKPQSRAMQNVLDRVCRDQTANQKQSAPASTSTTAEFSFMLRDGRASIEAAQKNNPQIVRIGPHPCGASATARVTVMPDADTQGDLVPDKVVEVDAQNNTVRRWAKPVDSALVAIKGDQILVDGGDGKRYWIDPSGNFQLQNETTSTAKPNSLGRMKGHSEFGNSGYANLWQYTDQQSGQSRRIIYEAVCT